MLQNLKASKYKPLIYAINLYFSMTYFHNYFMFIVRGERTHKKGRERKKNKRGKRRGRKDKTWTRNREKENWRRTKMGQRKRGNKSYKFGKKI